jgi:hypothetical protein
MKDYDLERLIESGDITKYVYEDDEYTENVKITFPSGLVLSISSSAYNYGASGLIVEVGE